MTKNYKIRFTIYYEDGSVEANREKVVSGCYTELQAKFRCEQEIRSDYMLASKKIRSIYMYECTESNFVFDFLNGFKNK